jgi:hypothetical protein
VIGVECVHKVQSKILLQPKYVTVCVGTGGGLRVCVDCVGVEGVGAYEREREDVCVCVIE